MLLSLLTLSASLAALVVGAAIVPRETFVLNQERATSVRTRGPAALARAYLKYGAIVPGHVQAAVGLQKRSEKECREGQTAAAIWDPSLDYQEFITPISIGTPPKTFNFDCDTGSSDNWVASVLQPAAQQAGHNLYDPSKSSTAKQLKGSYFRIVYEGGLGPDFAQGLVYNDTVNFGGVVFPSQCIEPANSTHPDFYTDTTIDGLFGLGTDAGNEVKPIKQKSFFSNVKNQLAAPLFAVNLGRKNPGSYDFGYVDANKYTGYLTYYPANISYYQSINKSWWGITLAGYGVAGTGKQPQVKIPIVINAIADTGTPSLLFHHDIVASYYSQAPQASNQTATYGGFVFNCNQALPDFTINIGQEKYVIPGYLMNAGPVAMGSSTCYSFFQEIPVGPTIPPAVLGVPFFQAVYTVFKHPTGGMPEIGCATKIVN